MKLPFSPPGVVQIALSRASSFRTNREHPAVQDRKEILQEIQIGHEWKKVTRNLDRILNFLAPKSLSSYTAERKSEFSSKGEFRNHGHQNDLVSDLC